jgi:hypothetical protein
MLIRTESLCSLTSGSVLSPKFEVFAAQYNIVSILDLNPVPIMMQTVHGYMVKDRYMLGAEWYVSPDRHVPGVQARLPEQTEHSLTTGIVQALQHCGHFCRS